MKVIHGLERIEEAFRYPVITLGNFDGLHLGHQFIFREVVKKAKETGGTAITLTFEPHPLKVMAPDRPLRLLTTFEEKVRLIKAKGIDILICVNFTKAFADQAPRDFVKNVLHRRLGVAELFVGHDFAFGKGRKGTVESLKEMASELGFKIFVIDAIKVGNDIVSSSKIRDLLLEGKVKEASLFLGRPYSIEGKVIKGEGRGATLLGFPTANLETPDLLIPKEGIYAVTVEFDGKDYKGAANIGYKPTFGSRGLNCEVHILDFIGDLLGSRLRITFIERLRDEATFTRPEALSEQIRKDVEKVRDILSTATLCR